MRPTDLRVVGQLADFDGSKSESDQASLAASELTYLDDESDSFCDSGVHEDVCCLDSADFSRLHLQQQQQLSSANSRDSQLAFNFNYSRFRSKATRHHSLATSSESSGDVRRESVASNCGDGEYALEDRYLFAIKEDLVDWFAHLYPSICGEMTPVSFMEYLRNGELLMLHVRNLKCYHARQARDCFRDDVSTSSVEDDNRVIVNMAGSIYTVDNKYQGHISSPRRLIQQGQPTSSSTVLKSKGSWLARDHVSNFIQFCRRRLGVKECVMFETEDLVSCRNEKNVVLTLLEVARHGVKWGMPPPTLVRLEMEIDKELARSADIQVDTPISIDEIDSPTPLVSSCEPSTVSSSSSFQQPCISEPVPLPTELPETPAELDNTHSVVLSDANSCRVVDEARPTLQPIASPVVVENVVEPAVGRTSHVRRQSETETCIKNVDQMVSDLARRCECPTRFPITCISPGKYRIGDSQILIFVRILRSHVMVRVGGGWDTLEHYLNKHDPCRRCVLLRQVTTESSLPGGKYMSHHKVTSTTYTSSVNHTPNVSLTSLATKDVGQSSSILGTVTYHRESSVLSQTSSCASTTATPAPTPTKTPTARSRRNAAVPIAYHSLKSTRVSSSMQALDCIPASPRPTSAMSVGVPKSAGVSGQQKRNSAPSTARDPSTPTGPSQRRILRTRMANSVQPKSVVRQYIRGYSFATPDGTPANHTRRPSVISAGTDQQSKAPKSSRSKTLIRQASVTPGGVPRANSFCSPATFTQTGRRLIPTPSPRTEVRPGDGGVKSRIPCPVFELGDD